MSDQPSTVDGCDGIIAHLVLPHQPMLLPSWHPPGRLGCTSCNYFLHTLHDVQHDVQSCNCRQFNSSYMTPKAIKYQPDAAGNGLAGAAAGQKTKASATITFTNYF
jgi:hypothetical protein